MLTPSFFPEGWKNLPVDIWSMIVRLTGATAPVELTDRNMRRIDISHLWKEYPCPSTQLCWFLIRADDLRCHGFDRTQDEVLFLEMPLWSVHFQADHHRSCKQSSDTRKRRREVRGQLDPSLDPVIADVYLVSHGMALVSAPYTWRSHYFNATPDLTLKRLYYDTPIPDYGGTTVGDRLRIHPDTVVRLTVFSGSSVVRSHSPVLLAGRNSDLVIRPGMAITFQNTESPIESSALDVLSGLVIDIAVSGDDASVSVQLVLVHRNLPASFMDWKYLGAAKALQTRLVMQVRPENVIAVIRILPHALHQHGAEKRTSSRTPGSVDLVVVGDLHFEVLGSQSSTTMSTESTTDQCRSPEALRILHAMHVIQDGTAQNVKMHLRRVTPFVEKEALEVISKNCKLYGTYGLGRDSWLRYIADALDGWALDKCKVVRDTHADNTLHLRIPGSVFTALLHDVLPWTKHGGKLGMEHAVTLCDGLLKVQLPNFQSAAALLGRNTGKFDFTSYRLGFVELFPPIVCKWEMFDSGRDPSESRSPDGFVAITFAYYEQKNADDDFVITTTKGNRHSQNQLNRPPSGCPR